MSNVYVAGVGMTPYGKLPTQSIKDMTRAAVDQALADAGIARERIRVAFFANATQSPLEGQHMIGGQIALRAAGFEQIPVTNVENACASGATAFHLAYAQVKAGLADVALAVGAEKMYGPDRAKMFSVFDGAWDVAQAESIQARLEQLGANTGIVPDAAFAAGERSVFMELYAALAKLHMKTFGTTQRQLAAVAAKNHKHSVGNPLSQYRKDMTLEEVLAARVIAWPLTLPMCSPISDGAAAAILVSEDAVTGLAARRAVRVGASIVASGSDRSPEDYDRHICRRAALRAYEAAGVGPREVSVAEVHDATAFAEILQSEALGFFEFGQGGPMAERGETALGGRIPINTSGGLESKGHPIGATGLGQIHELVTQLRHEAGPRQVENARIALAENGGGFQGWEEAAACITILAR
jgi:acetyl-CoA acetyltransferase